MPSRKSWKKRNRRQKNEILKIKLKKVIQRKGNFETSAKTCKSCNKDYFEKENFNWSCRVHASDFGGEMWWCCGKNGKDQPGCKFSKHASKEDELDL